MSKASDFTEAFKAYRETVKSEPEAPCFWFKHPGGGRKMAYVGPGGWLGVGDWTGIPAETAIDLAHWIIDTFGDPDANP